VSYLRETTPRCNETAVNRSNSDSPCDGGWSYSSPEKTRWNQLIKTMFSRSRVTQLAAYLLYHNAAAASQAGVVRASLFTPSQLPIQHLQPKNPKQVANLSLSRREFSLTHGADLTIPADSILMAIPEVKYVLNLCPTCVHA